MLSIIRGAISFCKGLSKYIGGDSVVDFFGEVFQEVAILGLSNPGDPNSIAIVASAVAGVFVAKTLVLALWKRTRNRPQTELESAKKRELHG